MKRAWCLPRAPPLLSWLADMHPSATDTLHAHARPVFSVRVAAHSAPAARILCASLSVPLVRSKQKRSSSPTTHAALVSHRISQIMTPASSLPSISTCMKASDVIRDWPATALGDTSQLRYLQKRSCPQPWRCRAARPRYSSRGIVGLTWNFAFAEGTFPMQMPRCRASGNSRPAGMRVWRWRIRGELSRQVWSGTPSTARVCSWIPRHISMSASGHRINAWRLATHPTLLAYFSHGGKEHPPRSRDMSKAATSYSHDTAVAAITRFHNFVERLYGLWGRKTREPSSDVS